MSISTDDYKKELIMLDFAARVRHLDEVSLSALRAYYYDIENGYFRVHCQNLCEGFEDYLSLTIPRAPSL